MAIDEDIIGFWVIYKVALIKLDRLDFVKQKFGQLSKVLKYLI